MEARGRSVAHGSNELEPPALTPPAPVAAIAPAEAANRVPLRARRDARGSTAKSVQFIGDLTTLDPHGSEFKARVDAILALGEGDIRASASVANRMLERPMNAMKKRRLRRLLAGFESARRPAQHGRVARPVQSRRSALAAQAARPDPVRQQARRPISTATARPKTISTRSSKRSTARRTSCSATTRRSNKRRPRCGR